MAVNHELCARPHRHPPHNLEYANAANRIAGTPEITGKVLTNDQLYQYARQQDDDSIWMLTSITPSITWQLVSKAGDQTIGGDLIVDGDVTLTGGGTMTTTANGNVYLEPNGTGITVVGSNSTSRGLNSPDDILISGKIEVDGNAYFDGAVRIPDNISLIFGNSDDAALIWRSSESPQTMLVALATISRSLLLVESGDEGFNHAHPQQTNPTLFVHSSNQSTTEWISLTHDQTDGVIDCGAGTLNLGGTANVNFAGATRTASTVTHDAYVELEVAGTLYKFMLGN